jgi:hypothetical protein
MKNYQPTFSDKARAIIEEKLQKCRKKGERNVLEALLALPDEALTVEFNGHAYNVVVGFNPLWVPMDGMGHPGFVFFMPRASWKAAIVGIHQGRKLTNKLAISAETLENWLSIPVPEQPEGTFRWLGE